MSCLGGAGVCLRQGHGHMGLCYDLGLSTLAEPPGSSARRLPARLSETSQEAMAHKEKNSNLGATVAALQEGTERPEKRVWESGNAADP